MRTYELTLILRSSLKDADKKKIIEMVKKWLDTVKIKKEDDWGQKPLAYSIKHEISGQYYLLHLESENAIPVDLEQKILANESVLRHLLIRTN
jgi:small subunit ribosomal protein S6